VVDFTLTKDHINSAHASLIRSPHNDQPKYLFDMTPSPGDHTEDPETEGGVTNCNFNIEKRTIPAPMYTKNGSSSSGVGAASPALLPKLELKLDPCQTSPKTLVLQTSEKLTSHKHE